MSAQSKDCMVRAAEQCLTPREAKQEDRNLRAILATEISVREVFAGADPALFRVAANLAPAGSKLDPNALHDEVKAHFRKANTREKIPLRKLLQQADRFALPDAAKQHVKLFVACIVLTTVKEKAKELIPTLKSPLCKKKSDEEFTLFMTTKAASLIDLRRPSDPDGEDTRSQAIEVAMKGKQRI